jgi:hypothetical protein
MPSQFGHAVNAKAGEMKYGGAADMSWEPGIVTVRSDRWKMVSLSREEHPAR